MWRHCNLRDICFDSCSLSKLTQVGWKKIICIFQKLSFERIIFMFIFFFYRGPAIKVRTGLIDLKNPGDTLQERTVVERISHPNYRYPRKYHDIALLKLQAPFDLNQYVRPACLQVQTSIAEKSAIASGFGKTNTSWFLFKNKNK